MSAVNALQQAERGGGTIMGRFVIVVHVRRYVVDAREIKDLVCSKDGAKEGDILRMKPHLVVERTYDNAVVRLVLSEHGL